MKSACKELSMACPKHAMDVSSFYGNKDGEEDAARKERLKGPSRVRWALSILVSPWPP